MARKTMKPATPSGGRSISVPDNAVASSNNEHPAFCFEHLRRGYHLDNCTLDEKGHFITTLCVLSQLTWQQIQLAPRHANGSEIIKRKSIKECLPSNTPEDRVFLSFRLGGKMNSVFLGYRKDKIFHVVWIDPKGQVYDHG